jgi:hypothetical protein
MRIHKARQDRRLWVKQAAPRSLIDGMILNPHFHAPGTGPHPYRQAQNIDNALYSRAADVAEGTSRANL